MLSKWDKQRWRFDWKIFEQESVGEWILPLYFIFSSSSYLSSLLFSWLSIHKKLFFSLLFQIVVQRKKVKSGKDDWTQKNCIYCPIASACIYLYVYIEMISSIFLLSTPLIHSIFLFYLLFIRKTFVFFFFFFFIWIFIWKASLA